MNPNMTFTFERRYPRLFRGGANWECGDGWAALLRDLFDRLERICELQDEADVEPALIVSVTECFGALRLQIEYAPPDMLPLVRAAENRSRTICETCGATGRIRSTAGRLQALCNTHAPLAPVMRRSPRRSVSVF